MRWLLYFVFLLAGIFLGFLIREIPYIDVQHPLRIGEAAQLLLTFTLALIIPFYIDRKLTNTRTEKDVIIEQIKRIRISLNDTRKKVNDCYYQKECSRKDFQQIIMGLRNISNGLTYLKDSLDVCKIKKARNSYDLVWKMYLNYKKDVSGGSIGSNKFEFTDKMFENHEKSFSALENLLNRLILEVNKH